MKNNFRKLFSILLAVVMVFSIMPSDVYAGTKWYSGYGTPYEGKVENPTCDNKYHDNLVWNEENSCWDYVHKNNINALTGGFFCDSHLRGKALSNKKVKISWTKNKEADGYEVVLSGRVKWYSDGIYNKEYNSYQQVLRFDSKYTTKKIINKNVNTVTLSIPNAIGDTVTYTQSEDHKDKTKDYQSLNNLFQVRYRVYKIVDGKKVWSEWSVLRPIGNKGNDADNAIYKGKQKTKKVPNYNATVLNFNDFVWYEHFEFKKW